MVLRQEVDDLRHELGEHRRLLDSERREKERVRERFLCRSYMSDAGHILSSPPTPHPFHLLFLSSSSPSSSLFCLPPLLLHPPALPLAQLSRDLGEERRRCQGLQLELHQQTEDISRYKEHLGRERKGGGWEMLEQQLRDRLRQQDREMAEQLDRIEVVCD